MINNSKQIEIVHSKIKELNSMSQRSCDAILAVLGKHYGSVRISVVNNLTDLEAVVMRAPDLVFLGMEFIPMNPSLGRRDPNKIWLSEYFDEHNVACTGSSQPAHYLERYKALAKQQVQEAGLKTAPFFVLKQNQPISHALPLKFPLFIKPENRGGGLGVDSNSVVHNLEQLIFKTKSIHTNLQSDALVEEYLPGREFSVAILKDSRTAKFLVMPIELVAPADKNAVRILSSKVKSSDTERVVAVTDKDLRSKLTALALNVFLALGARDYGRIDIRLDKRGEPHFLEANLIPSLIDGYGSFPRACMLNLGLSHESMIVKIAELGLVRNLNNPQNVRVFSPVVNSPLLETSPGLV